MYKDFSSFEELTTAASKYLREVGRAENSIKIYVWVWKRLKAYMDENEVVACNAEVVVNYIKATFGNKSISKLTHYQKNHFRCAVCLAQFTETGKMSMYLDRKEKYQLTGCIGKQMLQFLDYKMSMRVSKITLQAYKWHLYRFLCYLTEEKIKSSEMISPLDIFNYATTMFPEEIAAKNLSLIVIRKFLKYLYEQGLIQRNLSIIVPKDNYRQQAKLPSVYTKEEILTILGSIDRSLSLGKRNYAILLFAIRLGMRASDISALKFQNIDWATNRISFVQEKTAKPIELPLPADVGEAMIDYIKYARPTSKDKHLFLRTRYPHRPIDSYTISNQARKIIVGSGVKIGNRKHGSHAMRHSMASFLLEAGTTLPVISELLGHETTKTTMCYLRIDIESLRQCALDVPQIPISFYEQKGGVFYV